MKPSRKLKILQLLQAGPAQLLELAAALGDDDPAVVQATTTALLGELLISSAHHQEVRDGQRRTVATYSITEAGRARIADSATAKPSREPEVLRQLYQQGGLVTVARHLEVAESTAREILRKAGVRSTAPVKRHRGPPPVVWRKAWNGR